MISATLERNSPTISGSEKDYFPFFNLHNHFSSNENGFPAPDAFFVTWADVYGVHPVMQREEDITWAGIYSIADVMQHREEKGKVFFLHAGPTAPLSRVVMPFTYVVDSLVYRVDALIATGNEDAALKEISRATSLVKETEEFEKLSFDLKLFDLRNYSNVILIALLRNTFSIRHHISVWPELLVKVEKILDAKKEGSACKLLRGLSVKS